MDISKITKVYSGVAGKCMCGCSGKWTYPAGKSPEYAGSSFENNRAVKIIAGKVLRNPAHQLDAEAKCWHVTNGNRILAVYFED